MPEETTSGVQEGNVPEMASERLKNAGESGMLSPEPEAPIESRQEQVAGKYDEILAQVVSPSAADTYSDDAVASDVTNIDATLDEESKIRQLLDLAGTKGVAYAVKVARSLNDYYALDRMHDELADKLYAGLLARGLIRKE
ncbi:MAG: hypothetical protein WAW00_01900 [Candidatus Moraniibacteriota bacterium]